MNFYYLNGDISEYMNTVLNGKDVAQDINDRAKNLYYLYECSDEIQFITNNPQYPSMLNYVKTGIITEEEMIQAYIYK